MNWTPSEQEPYFLWDCSAQDVEFALPHHSLLWHYGALFGGLFHMDRKMWRKLPWKDEFPLSSPNVRPQVAMYPKIEDNKTRAILLSIPK
jgi:hypothetical protein